MKKLNVKQKKSRLKYYLDKKGEKPGYISSSEFYKWIELHPETAQILFEPRKLASNREGYKQCHSCHNIFPLSYFGKNAHAKDNRQKLCKNCSYIKFKKWEKIHKKMMRKKLREEKQKEIRKKIEKIESEKKNTIPTPEVVRLLSYPTRAITKLTKKGYIPAVKVGFGRGSWRYKLDQIQNLEIIKKKNNLQVRKKREEIQKPIQEVIQSQETIELTKEQKEEKKQQRRLAQGLGVEKQIGDYVRHRSYDDPQKIISKDGDVFILKVTNSYQQKIVGPQEMRDKWRFIGKGALPKKGVE